MKLINLLIAASFFLATSVAAEVRPDTRLLMCMNSLADVQYRDFRQDCATRFPELQGPMEEAQTAWTKRNETALARFDAACRERLSELETKNKVAYDTFQVQAREIKEYGLAQMQSGDLLSTCSDFVESIRTTGRMDVPEILIEDPVSPGSSLRPRADLVPGQMKFIATPSPPPLQVRVPVSTEPSSAVDFPGTPRPSPSTPGGKR